MREKSLGRTKTLRPNRNVLSESIFALKCIRSPRDGMPPWCWVSGPGSNRVGHIDFGEIFLQEEVLEGQVLHNIQGFAVFPPC